MVRHFLNNTASILSETAMGLKEYRVEEGAKFNIL